MKVYLIYEEYYEFGEWKSEVESVVINKEKAYEYLNTMNYNNKNSSYSIEEVNAKE